MDLNSESGKEPKTLVFTNEEDGKELFRIYLSNLTIKYDEKFEEIIELNPELKLELTNVNELLLNKKITYNDIPNVISAIVYKHIEYIKNKFYSNSEELPKKITKKIKTSSSLIKSPELFFERLKSKNLLIPITKKEFESYIHPQILGQQYVEAYQKKSKYYYYQLFNREPFIQHWYFATNKDRLFFSFALEKI